jgi:hypothetical protein
MLETNGATHPYMMGECNLDGFICIECRRDGSRIAKQIVQQKDGYLKSCR